MGEGTVTKLSVVQFGKGAYIIVEGKSGAGHFYIIRTGKVQILKTTEIVQEQDGGILGPGDFFGVISSMASQRRIETARALTDVSLIMVPKEEYVHLIKNNKQVPMKIISSFARRMRHLDDALAKLTTKHATDTDITHIYSIAQYYLKQKQYNQAYYALYQYIRLCSHDIHIDKAKQELESIKPHAKAVYLDSDTNIEFNRKYPKDTVIFLEMMRGSEMYIIQQGSVKITKVSNDNEIMLALLRTGDIFGEMALIDQKPRSASAITFEDSVLLAVNRINFERIVDTQPQVIARLTVLLAERIWVLYRQLANTTIVNKLGRLYDALLVQLEKDHVALVPGQAYTLGFGPQELINWVGVPLSEGDLLIRELLNDRSVNVIEGKIYISNVEEVYKQAQYYRKMQK